MLNSFTFACLIRQLAYLSKFRELFYKTLTHIQLNLTHTHTLFFRGSMVKRLFLKLISQILHLSDTSSGAALDHVLD